MRITSQARGEARTLNKLRIGPTGTCDKGRDDKSEWTRALKYLENNLAQVQEAGLRQLQTGEPRNVVETVSKIEGLLAVGGASLVYAGYPTDPFA
jgi:hypothetical protein